MKSLKQFIVENTPVVGNYYKIVNQPFLYYERLSRHEVKLKVNNPSIPTIVRVHAEHENTRQRRKYYTCRLLSGNENITDIFSRKSLSYQGDFIYLTARNNFQSLSPDEETAVHL